MEAFCNRSYDFTLFCFHLINGSTPRKDHVSGTLPLILTFSLVFTTGIYLQLRYLYKHDVQLFDMVNIVPNVTIMLFSMIMVHIVYWKRKHNKKLLSLMADDWQRCQNADVFRLKRKHKDRASMWTTLNWLYGYAGVTVVILQSLLPPLFDTTKPMNESNERHSPFLIGAGFIDVKNQYFLMLLLQIAMCYIIATLVLLGMNIFVIVIYELCGMLEVVRHQLQSIRPAKSKRGNCELIFLAEEYQKTLEFILATNTATNEYLFFCLLITIGTLGISLAEVLDLDLMTANNVFFTVTHLLHFFFLNYMGQQMMDGSMLISIAAYNSRWYEFQAPLRRYFLLIMMRSHKVAALTTAGLYTYSFEGYSWVLRCAISYSMIVSKLE